MDEYVTVLLIVITGLGILHPLLKSTPPIKSLLFFLITGSLLILVSSLVYWASGAMAGMFTPIADLLGLLSMRLPGPPAFRASLSIALLFLLFRIILLPHWAMHGRVNRSTGEARPDFVSSLSGGNHGDWWAEFSGPTACYPTNRTYMRWILLLLMNGIFYFIVMRAIEPGVASWPPSSESLNFNNTLIILTGSILGSLVICFIAFVLALVTAKLLADMLYMAGGQAYRRAKNEGRVIKETASSKEFVGEFWFG